MNKCKKTCQKSYQKNNQKSCKKDMYLTCNCQNSHKHTQSTSSCTEEEYVVESRVQFSVIASPDDICYLTTMIGNAEINLDGALVQALNNDCSIFSFTIGNGNKQSCKSLDKVRCILNKLCMDFEEDKVLRVILPSEAPGTFAKVYCALSSNDIGIYSAYPSFDGEAVFIEASCIEKAKEIL